MPSNIEGGKSKLVLLWHQRGTLGKMTLVVATLMITYHLLFVSGVLAHLGIYIMVQPHQGLSLCFMLLIVFLTTPARSGTKRQGLPWYDIVLILFSLASAGYYFAFQGLATDHLQRGMATTTEIVLMFLLVIVLLEAARRLVGAAMSILALFFIFHALFTSYFPGILSGRSFSLERLTLCFYLGPDGIFGQPMVVASTTIVVFITFATFLHQSGAADLFLKLAMSLFGTVRGGPAKIAIFASALFGTISGSTSANVAATGSVTIPLMKSIGYSPEFAGAVEAVASKGGQITPPVMGTVAFLMAQITGLGYAAVCIMAALPALLYFVAIYLQVDFRAAKMGLRGLPREQLPSLKETMKRGWYYLVPLLALVVLIMVVRYNPAMAAIYSLLLLVVLTYFRRETRMGPAELVSSFERAGKAVCTPGVACALAGVILGSLMGTGLGVTFAAQMLRLSGGNIFALLGLTAIAAYVMGMGLPSIPIYLVLVTLVAPALTRVGVRVEAAHLFLIYWGNVSYITPPVALAAFVAAGIAGCDPMKVGWQAVRLAIVTFVVPFMFIFQPSLLLIGQPAEVVLAAVTGIGGVIALAAAMEGYLVTRANWIEKAILFASGLLLVYPGWATDLVGIGIMMPIILHQLRRGGQVRKATDSQAAG